MKSSYTLRFLAILAIFTLATRSGVLTADTKTQSAKSPCCNDGKCCGMKVCDGTCCASGNCKTGCNATAKATPKACCAQKTVATETKKSCCSKTVVAQAKASCCTDGKCCGEKNCTGECCLNDTCKAACCTKTAKALKEAKADCCPNGKCCAEGKACCDLKKKPAA